MEKKLPGIYKGKDYSHVNNNRKVFISKEIKELNPIEEANINDYLLNTPVLIETKDNKTIKAKIISKRNDYILMDNKKIIKHNNIKKIKYL